METPAEAVSRILTRWGQAIRVAERREWSRRTGLPWRQFDDYAAAAARIRKESPPSPLACVSQLRPLPLPLIPGELALGAMIDLTGPATEVVAPGPALTFVRPDGERVEVAAGPRGITRGAIRDACAVPTPRYLLRGKESGAPWRLIAE